MSKSNSFININPIHFVFYHIWKCLHLNLLFVAMMTKLKLFIVHVLTYACWQENKTNDEGNKITNVAAYMSILLQELKHLPFYVLNLSNLLYVTRLPLLNSPSYVDNVILVVTICNQKGLMMFTIYMYMYTCTNL